MKTQRLEPLDLFKSREDLPPKGEYFISSFYKTADRSLLLHAKHHNSSNNLSQKSLTVLKPKSKMPSIRLNKTQTKEALQFYSKKNKLNIMFDDPESRQSLFKRPHNSEKVDENNLIYFNKSENKAHLVKTKPARFSLQIIAKQSEKFTGLLNKFQFNLKAETPEPNYLKEKIGHFLKKTKYNAPKKNEVSNDSPKYKELIQKLPHVLEPNKTPKGFSIDEIQEYLKSAQIDQRKVSFNMESLNDMKRLITGQIIENPLNIDTIYKPNSEKNSIREMLKQKKEEISKRGGRNPSLKIDLNSVNLNRMSEVEEILSTSPLLNNQKKMVVSQQRPDYKRSYPKLRKVLKEALIYLASLKLTMTDLTKNCVFSKKPYQKEGSYELIKAAKRGNVEIMKKLLDYNRFLIFDFDNVYMTALHWATRRGNIEAAVLLIKKGADINAKDIIGRTPLYIALQCERNDFIKLLLYFKANPWSSLQVNYNAMMKPNTVGQSLITKARKLHILMKMTPAHLRQGLWQRESWLVFLEGGADDLFKKLNEKPVEN